MLEYGIAEAVAIAIAANFFAKQLRPEFLDNIPDP